MTLTELALLRENIKLKREIEEIKRKSPMTAVQHLSRLKTQAEMIRKVYYDACNISK